MYFVFFQITAVPVLHSNTELKESDLLRQVILTDKSTYLPYCSELLYREVLVSCRATGDPTPAIDIYRENDDGSQTRFYPAFLSDNELAIALLPIGYRENIMLHCNASNIASYVHISVNLTYTCKFSILVLIWIDW